MSDRYNPFEDIDELVDRMTRGLDEVGGGRQDISVDVSETDEEVIVAADLPGYARENITLTVADRRLSIEAERDRSESATDGRYHRRERSQQRVRRTVYLPAEIEEETASATYENGVLTVTLPKRGVDEDEGHSIDIS